MKTFSDRRTFLRHGGAAVLTGSLPVTLVELAFAKAEENITFAYISDAHDFHGVSGNAHVAFGPGEAGYVQQLRDYDRAFADFFARLKRDGITKDNTLFVITVLNTFAPNTFLIWSRMSRARLVRLSCIVINTPSTWSEGLARICTFPTVSSRSSVPSRAKYDD